MIGQLQIFYKNGETRLIRLHPLFFTETRVSMATRALDIAHSHNPAPYRIYIYRDGVLKFQKVIERNDPTPPALRAQFNRVE